MSVFAAAILTYPPEHSLLSADEASPGHTRRVTLAPAWVSTGARLPVGRRLSLLIDTSLGLAFVFSALFRGSAL